MPPARCPRLPTEPGHPSDSNWVDSTRQSAHCAAGAPRSLARKSTRGPSRSSPRERRSAGTPTPAEVDLAGAKRGVGCDPCRSSLARVGAMVVLACLCAAPEAPSQTTRATLTGTVTDPNGAVVPGATVNATNIATNISSATTTNQEGTYTFTALPPGEYNVAVELTGFKRSLQTGIILQIAETSRLDIPLEVGAVNEEVSVVSQAPLVRSTSSEQGQVIDYKQIQSLPLNGRLFQQLITLTPGAIQAGFADFAENPAGAGARSAVHHSVNGLPWSGNNYLLDGVANNEPLNAFVNITPPLEALQEFKVQTNNPTAEFGVFGGAVVNLSIRSGTNQFSGSVFEYYRDESLNARNFFFGKQGALQLAPVRRDVRRTDAAQQGVLLRRLPAPPAGPGPHRDCDGPDRGDAPRRPQRVQHADLRSAERAAVRRQHHPERSHQSDHAAGRRHLAAAEPGGPGRQLHREQRGRAGAGRVRHPQRREPGALGVGLRPLLQSRSRVRRAAHGQHLHGRRQPVRVGQLQLRAGTHVHVVIEPAQRVPGRHQQVRPRAVRL